MIALPPACNTGAEMMGAGRFGMDYASSGVLLWNID